MIWNLAISLVLSVLLASSGTAGAQSSDPRVADLVQAGNVLRPKTAVKVSLRTPPTLKLNEAGKKLKTLFEEEVPLQHASGFKRS